ncbi:DUF3139 domain-containing protein [Paenibacillus cucumis (ex Kampfer et al. 2016)]|uniref:DUF3139 domain-containing protein n=2 Tax=Paenibacillus cucumis (ex Kampfer et al. 2016) TaxID=1776858 RepID=A0ABS7KK76_9BACL|nr:DUF3139 domain-containing protein [Paenibacillus cucumis (ex Kampfer et al. 2016)]MBY0204553.1 DUF3139 domain-containing protein [Paenibacillus cucumis (ex Kampfer et al. 2016)]
MKLLKTSLVLVTLVIIASLAWYGSYKSDMKKLEDKLRTYLTVEKGMDEQTITSITARRSKMPMYPVVVKFKDNPEEYIYYYREDEWIQLAPDPNS